MLKKFSCFICMLGLFFSAAADARSAIITSNDGTAITMLTFNVTTSLSVPAYPVVKVSGENVFIVVPFPDNIPNGGPFEYKYQISALGADANLWVWLNDTSEIYGVQIGMAVDKDGALTASKCEAGQYSSVYFTRCDISVSNGIAELDINLQSK